MINCTDDIGTADTCVIGSSTEISTDVQKEPIDEIHESLIYERVIPSITQSPNPSDSGTFLCCLDIQCDTNVTSNFL